MGLNKTAISRSKRSFFFGSSSIAEGEMRIGGFLWAETRRSWGSIVGSVRFICLFETMQISPSGGASHDKLCCVLFCCGPIELNSVCPQKLWKLGTDKRSQIQTLLHSMHPFFGDMSYAWGTLAPTNPLPLSFLNPMDPVLSSPSEGVLLGTDQGLVVPYDVIPQVDPLVISMQTQDGFRYDWILKHPIEHLIRVNESDAPGLTIPYRYTILLQTNLKTGVHNRYRTFAPEMTEIDIPFGPSRFGDGVSLRIRVESHDPVEDREEVVTLQGEAIVRSTGVGSTLMLTRGAVSEAENPNDLTVHDILTGDPGSKGYLPCFSFPGYVLEHIVTRVVMSTGQALCY